MAFYVFNVAITCYVIPDVKGLRWCIVCKHGFQRRR